MHSANSGSNLSKKVSKPQKAMSETTALYNSQPGLAPLRPTTIEDIPSRMRATGLTSKRF